MELISTNSSIVNIKNITEVVINIKNIKKFRSFRFAQITQQIDHPRILNHSESHNGIPTTPQKRQEATNGKFLT